MSNLTQDAEDYLDQLDKALWSLTPEQRHTVLLEMRSHFQERLSEGPLHLMSTLEHMGPPDEMARAFVEASGGLWRSQPANENGHLPVPIVGPRVSAPYRRKGMWAEARDIAVSFRQTYQASRNGLWTACAIVIPVLTATNFLGGVNKLSAGADGMPIWFCLIARIGVTIAAMIALYRALLTDDETQWDFDWPAAKFTVATLGMLALVICISLSTRWVADRTGLRSYRAVTAVPLDLIVVTAIAGLCACAYLRIQPWVVALVIGDGRVSLRSSFSRTTGRIRALILGWMIFVLPLMILHVGVTFASRQFSYPGFIRTGLSVCLLDSIISTLTLLSVTILNAVAFRWVAQEPIPKASSFSTVRLTDRQITMIMDRF